MEFIALHGVGLHGGGRCSVKLMRKPGPLLWKIDGEPTAPELLRVNRTDHGVQVSTPSGGRADLVEHLCAALAGAQIRDSLWISVSGGEVPILDGGALELSLALRALAGPRRRAPLKIAQPETIELGESSYFLEPGSETRVSVEVDFPGFGRQTATYWGDPDDFLHHVAPARSFGFEDERPALAAAGRAKGARLDNVLVLRRDGSCLSPIPPLPDELARHKLLDLIGDLYLYGGPPRGTLHAVRPGHCTNHALCHMALERGWMVQDSSGELDTA